MKRKTAGNFVSALLAFTLIIALGPDAVARNKHQKDKYQKVYFQLTILHNNDGESQVINAGDGLEDFGGAARFKTLVDRLKREATRGHSLHRGAKRGVIMLSSGDNFLAGPEFSASVAGGVPFFDTIAMELIGYDAINFGNHDFDFGPDVLADFLEGYRHPVPYVAANLDFRSESRLQAFVDARIIVPAKIIRVRGERIGVIGLNTPNLPFISSPRNVAVSDGVASIVQHQIYRLKRSGVNIIVLASHLQNIANEIDLVSEVKGLDAVIAGGGDELLANDDDLLLPGDEAETDPDMPYPMIAIDKAGRSVPVVTTSGEYRYVGRLILGFDKYGEVISIDDRSGPVRVATDDCSGTLPCNDTVLPDPEMQALVVDPVEAYLASLGDTIIGESEVALDGLRSSVRAIESNEGNLIADSQLWQAAQLAADYGVPLPDVALQNGGGIRNNTVIPAGPISELDTFDMVPFPNFVAVVPDIPRVQFKEILENAVACTQPNDFTANPLCGSGRFAQISGFSFTWFASGMGMILDGEGNVITPGTRIQEVVLNDGTEIVAGGVVIPGDPITIAIVDFLANGGDQYPFRGVGFTTVGVTYQQALSNYIQNGLGSSITSDDYPEVGEGRITDLP
jgi:5'-nucleotidase